MISWSFIKNQVSLIHWDYKKFLDEKVDTLENAGTLASTLTTANHEELKDMLDDKLFSIRGVLSDIKSNTYKGHDRNW